MVFLVKVDSQTLLVRIILLQGESGNQTNLHPILCTWDAVTTCTTAAVFFPLGMRLSRYGRKKFRLFPVPEHSANSAHSLVPRLWVWPGNEATWPSARSWNQTAFLVASFPGCVIIEVERG